MLFNKRSWPTLLHILRRWLSKLPNSQIAFAKWKSGGSKRRERELCDWNALEWKETPCVIQANLFTAAGMKYAEREKQVENRTNNELKLDYKSLKMKFSVCCWYFVGNSVASVLYSVAIANLNMRETLKWFDIFLCSFLFAALWKRVLTTLVK